jgi:ubiquinone/menaquinone biosynthesis C-methylase UbiE
MTFSSAVTLMMLLSPPDDHAHGDKHDRHGNPPNLDEYIAKMEAPDREEWQKPSQVLQVLSLKPGQVVCDIGAGPGYFALRLARAVGDRGTIYAVDVAPRILKALLDRIEQSGVRNVVPVFALASDPLLPREACDLILIVDTFHHFPEPVSYLGRLAASLRKGGRIVNIDFHKREMPVGPSMDHKISREEFLAKATAAGLKLTAEHTFLPYQYFLIFEADGARQR